MDFKKLRYVLLVLVSLGFSMSGKATLVTPVTSSFYTAHGATPANIINTSRSAYVMSDVTSPDVDLLKRGVITLGIDHHHTASVAEHHTVVTLFLKKWTTLSGSYDTTTISIDVDYKPNSQLEFNDDKLYEVNNVLKYEVTVTGIKVNNVSQNSLPANVFINLNLFVNRLYDFTSETSTILYPDDSEKLVDKDCDGKFDELTVSWDRIDGAEEYQLEWTFVNDYTEVDTIFKDSNDVAFDFKRNSTRIVTVDNHYNISLIYPHGYIIYRLRAVGRLASAPTKRVYTIWSTQDIGTVDNALSTLDANNYYHNKAEWEISKNWQYSASFAEEGKKKEVVSFYDGSLRNRQMVTVMNSKANNRAIVGETIYDHIGRPAVQVLPTPVYNTMCETPGDGSGTLKYYPAFNLDKDDKEYNYIDLLGTSCEVGANKMSNSTGASQYYSDNNPNIADAQGYLPDAAKYPFSQVEYTPDNTGRVRRQGGVGETFQLGEDHESKYYYAHPSQLELDRMFGSEVGDAAHYQKNMVMDPNGQVSVSYLDQEGRVIATSLAGEAASNTTALPSQAGANVELHDVFFTPKSKGNKPNHDGTSKIFNATIAVSATTDMTFAYGIGISNYTDNCLAEGICFGCVYDLTIDVTNDCGESMITETVDHNNVVTGVFTYTEDSSIVFNMDCDNSTVINGDLGFTIKNMPIGTYQVTKTLSINEAALDYYEEQYMDTLVNTCFKTLADFQDEYLSNMDLSGCVTDPTDCQACLDNLGPETAFIANGGTHDDYVYLTEQCQLPCKPLSIGEATRNLLLNDVQPNGQYGEYLTNGVAHPENFPLSVYNTNNDLPRSHSATPPVLADWQEPVMEKNGTTTYKYYESDLYTESKVQLLDVVLSGSSISSSNPAILNPTSFTYDSTTETYWTAPQNLSNVTDFIAKFKLSWAYSLIWYHPEYNYLKTYLEFGKEDTNNNSSDSFDSKMAQAETWQEAIDAGFIDSLYNGITPVENRLTDYTSTASPVYDLFTVSSFATTMGWSSSSSAFLSNLASYQGGYHIVEIAALIGRCPDTLVTSGCYGFGNDASGTGSGGITAADTAARNKDWQNFRSLYRSLKQQYEADLARDRAINNPAYYGYNACIGNASFDPFAYGFSGAVFGTGQYATNDEQPCYHSFQDLYLHKQRRFIPPGTSTVSENPVSATDAYDGWSDAAYTAYNLTGNCPASIALSALLDDMRETGHIDDASYALASSDYFVGYLMSQGLMTTPPTALPGWNWKASISGATLNASMVNGTTTIDTIQLVQQTGSPVLWSAVDQLNDFHSTGTGGLGYAFSAQIISGVDTIDILGSTSIDILNCTFDMPCTLNSVGADIYDLMNVMLSSTFDSTSPITILGSGADTIISPFVTEAILDQMNAANHPATVTWKYNSGANAFEISGSSSKTIRLVVAAKVPSLFSFYSSVTHFSGLEITDGNTFIVRGFNSLDSQIVELTLDAQLISLATTDLTIASCEIPSMGCDDIAVKNVAELQALLDDVLGNHSSAYNMFNSPFMTAGLAAQFELGLDTTMTSTSFVFVYDDGYDIGTQLISQTADTSVTGDTTTVVTVYRTVTSSTITTYTETVVCDRGECDTTLTHDTPVNRTIGKVNQTTIEIGNGCSLEIDMNEDLVHGSGINDIIHVLDLIPAGEADFDGNYHEFDLVVSLPFSVIDTLHGSICIPLRLCDTIKPFVFPTNELPTEVYTNPCVETAIYIAMANAENAYNNYIDTLLTNFRNAYISHCMSGAEDFSRVYNESEYHHTLYYYDQAGNLIKTVPPEGVELLPITSSSDALSVSIDGDRTEGTHTVLTSHRMETRYVYNSLNQLIAQHMPDQEDMSDWKQTLANGLDANLNTTAIQMLDASIGYLAGYVTTSNAPTGSRGYLYKTADGGTNWTRVTNLFPYDLLKVEMVSSTNGFAVGKSGVALRTVDGGATWDLMNMHSKGITGDFVDVAAQDANNAAFLMPNGHIIPFISNALGTEYTPGAPSVPSGASSITLYSGYSIEYNGSSNVYSVNLEFRNSSPVTYFTQMALVNISTPSTSYEVINGSAWNHISFPSGSLGVVSGPDGDLVFLTETGSNGTGTQYLQSANNNVGNILESIFIDKTTGIALIGNGGTYVYKTNDGGLNWTKISNTGASAIGAVYQNATNLYFLVSFGNGDITYYSTSNGGTAHALWTQSAAVFTTLTGYYDGTSYYLYGTHTSTIYSSTGFTLTGTTAPTISGYSGGLGTSSSFSAIKVVGVSPAIHVVVINNLLEVWDACSVSGGTPTKVRIGTSSGSYKDIAIGTNGGTYVLAYNDATRKVFRATLSTSAPAAGSLAAMNASATLMPSGISIISMALHGDYVSLASNAGSIYCSKTAVTSSSSANLDWIDRSNLRISPIRSASMISYPNTSPTGNAVAVGDLGVALKRSTSNVWTVFPLGLTVNPSGSADITPQLNSTAAANISSVPYVLLVGQGAIAKRWNLNTNALTSFTTGTFSAGSYPNFLGVACNTSGNAAITSSGSKVYYYTHFDTSPTSPNTVTTGTDVLNAVSFPTGSSTAIVAGNAGRTGTVSSSTYIVISSIYGPGLNSVHFASSNIGTVAGDNFFVRATSNAGTLWSRILPSTINATNLQKAVTKTWTRATSTSAPYSILGGSAYLATGLNGVATPASYTPSSTVKDIQFSSTNVNTGYFSDGPTLKKIVLTASGSTYTAAYSSPLLASLSTDINAIHVFTHGSNTTELMLVGTNMIRYKAEGANTTTSMLGGVAGTIRDVVFTGTDHGYVVGDAGLFYETDVISYNTSGTEYTAMTWSQKLINDANTGALSNINVRALEFPSASHGVWGGYYTTSPGSVYAAVRVLDVQHQTNSARFYYDRLGRIVVSQNSRQHAQNKYSYTLYDALGRVYEAGEKTENTAGGGATFFASVFGTSVGGQYVASVIDDTKLNTWITTQSNTTRKEVTRSYYDAANAQLAANGLSAFFTFNTATQRKRIVHVSYEETYDGKDSTYDHATHYDYDIHGNVQTLIQDNKKMGALAGLSTQRFKKLEYVYDLISGNVHRVDYESGDADQWHHAYQYDADNRILEAYTTTATPLFDPDYGMVEVQVEPLTSPYWSKEVAYAYYDHGPLARTVLGEETVQGLDYVYTLQGWIKGVNSNTLDTLRDPGKDGIEAYSNRNVALDVMGYSLHYYTDDYLPVVSGNGTFIATQTSSDLVNTSNSKDMYNGNIARMVTTITDPNTRAVLPLGNAYKYDQLNRLSTAISYTNLNTSTNTWGSGGTGIYANNFTYDANGNILTQLRKNESAAIVDSLRYFYQKNSAGKTTRNRLYHVHDATSSGTYSDDIDDMGTYSAGGTINTANNYVYDEEGRLIKDVQEGISNITWRVDGKVKAITMKSGSTKKNLTFDYDAMGHRIAKHILNNSNVLEKSTYYVLDAQGNVMSTYEREIDSPKIYFTQKEKFIYGSSRVGVLRDSIGLLGSQNATYSQSTWNHVIGKRNYELTNHLGSAISVISDKPIPHTSGSVTDFFLTDIRQSTDYSAFGVQLSGRTLTASAVSKKYRMGYQGSEMDNEIKGDGNSYTTEFRQLDPRLGRWLSIDPKFDPSSSPYNSMDNNPVALNDILGLSTNGWGGKYKDASKGAAGGIDWTYREELSQAHHEGYDVYMDEGPRPNFNTGDGYVGPVYLESDGSIQKGGSYVGEEVVLNFGKGSGGTSTEDPFIPTTESSNGAIEGVLHYDEGYAAQSFRKVMDDMRFNNLCNGLDNMVLFMAGGAAALPVLGTTIGVASVYAPIIWGNIGGAYGVYKGVRTAYNTYDRYIGSRINYSGMGWNYISQSMSSGSIGVGNKDVVSFVLSGTTKNMPLWMQSAIGATSGLGQYTLNDGGAFFKGSAAYIIGTSAMGALQPRLAKSRFGNNLSSTVVFGFGQTLLNVYEKGEKWTE